MKKILITLALLLLAGAMQNRVFGQACCSAGVPLLGSLELPAMPAGHWRLGATYQLNQLSDVIAGSSMLRDDTRERRVHTVTLETSYGLTNRISMSALLSLIGQERLIRSPVGGRNELTTRGWGDAVLLLKYNLVPLNMATQRELTIGAGPKVPLGKSNVTNDGIRVPADMQPGSGAWDMVLWAYGYQGFLPHTRLNLFGTVSARLTGENDWGYRFGNEVVATLNTSYRTDSFFDLSLGAHFRHTAPDQFNGSDFPNTGGLWVSAAPAVNFKLSPVTLRASLRLPVYRNLNGTQLTTSRRISVTVFYAFQKSTINSIEF